MLFKNLFKSFFITNLLDYHQIEGNGKVESICNLNLANIILYESFIPIEALAFYIGTVNPSNSALKDVINSILISKKLILKKTEILSKFFNFEEPISEKGKLKSILQFRSNLIKNDLSYIFKEIIKENLNEIKNCLIEESFSKKLEDPKLDIKYEEMIYRIKSTIKENLNVNEKIKNERLNFYREFEDVSKMKKEKISLNLGGNFINPVDLSKIIYRVNLPDKRKVVTRWMNLLLSPIEELSVIKVKDIVEQKFDLIEYINEVISPKTGKYDDIYELRSNIFKAAKMDAEEKQLFMQRQIKHNLNILKLVENIQSDSWIIRYSKQIKEDYINYLMSNQDVEKVKLLSNFND